jgi:hypothetical protein
MMCLPVRRMQMNRPWAISYPTSLAKLMIAVAGMLACGTSAGLMMSVDPWTANARSLTALLLVGAASYALAAMTQTGIMAALRWLFH